MAKQGPILIVEDDEDDQDMIRDILLELGVQNELVIFSRGPEAMHYLKSSDVQPFLILSDVNLPQQNGIEFKRQIDEDPELRARSIPFVFLSTSADRHAVNEAYTQLTVQGFFQKRSNFRDQAEDLQLIINYWMNCKHPNS